MAKAEGILHRSHGGGYVDWRMRAPIPLQLAGNQPIDLDPAAHVLVSVIRNEMLRLPYFLEYYRALGIDRFMLIENLSTDGTVEFLLGQPDVILLSTEQNFGANHFGMDWLNPLLDQHCDRRWILLADADELLVWPGCDGQTIKQLTTQLSAAKAAGLFTLLIDMYSDRPFGQIGYVAGEPFTSRCPFFDRAPYREIKAGRFPYHQMYGGVRERIVRGLGGGQYESPTLSKLPLLRWHRGQAFSLVAHGLAKELALAPMRGALLHFKLFDDISEKCRINIARKQNYVWCREQAALLQAIEKAPNHCFFDPDISVRFADTRQLVELGIMNESDPFAGLPS